MTAAGNEHGRRAREIALPSGAGSQATFGPWRPGSDFLTSLALLAPAAILFTVVIIIPILQSMWISLHDWDGLGEPRWVGLANYVELFGDPQFYVSLRNNLIWLAVFLLAPPLGLALAMLINQPLRWMGIAKSLFFVPLVLAPVTVGVVFTWFYDPAFGLLAPIARAFGTTAPAILSDPSLVTWGIVVAAIWPQTALCMILYLAGLTNVDEDLIGAGRIDGAHGFSLFRHVVLPQLRGATFIAFAVSVVGALRSFDLIAVMTQGGPFGSSSVLAYQMYEQSIFSYRLGYGAAIAVVLFLIVAVFIAWYLRRVLGEEARN
ncbi:sugar ABC transporter permease [Chelativorans sp.]|uniref:carbohydrate ABC transporter permease n=1 Tax=Chelativorans sp. TaxID=2203393 RepID=UPI0028121001|nr:sugar ABC transporter permease [Chelativorans sp.]